MASERKRPRFCDEKFPSWWEDGSGRFLLQGEGPPEAREACAVCKLRFAAGDRDVERTVLGRELQQCRICKASIPASQLFEHIMELHLKVHRCHACNAGFVKAAELAQHTADCQRLGNTVEGSVARPSHQPRSEPEATSVQYRCRFCDKEFSYKAVFMAHMNKHTGPRPYYCGDCKRQMATREELEWHVEHDCDGGVDLPRRPFEYVVPEAPGSAWTKGAAAAHGERHEGDGPPC